MPLLEQSSTDFASSSIVADGVFDYVRLWRIKLKGVYGPMIYAFAYFGRPFSTFVYDWREDLNVTGHPIELYLEDISIAIRKEKM